MQYNYYAKFYWMRTYIKAVSKYLNKKSTSILNLFFFDEEQEIIE